MSRKVIIWRLIIEILILLAVFSAVDHLTWPEESTAADAPGNSRRAGQLTGLWDSNIIICRPHPAPAAVPELSL